MGRILDEIPNHKRILKPLLRRNVPVDFEEKISLGELKEEDIISLECQDFVNVKWHEELNDKEIEENLYYIYKDLKKDGIIWTDIKPENVGKSQNGELVILDMDRIYKEDNLPEFNKYSLDRSLYMQFEKRFLNEEETIR